MFAVLAGALLGTGLAVALHGHRVPAGRIEAVIHMIVGGTVALGGGLLGITSVAMRRAHHVGHLFGWVWLLRAPRLF